MNTTGPVMTLTDELLAELESHVTSWKRAASMLIKTIDVALIIAEVHRLRAENAELAKDAGRLEWMVAEGAVIARMNGTGRPMCYQVSFPFESCQQLDWFPSWREAVDAMMAAQ